MTDEKIKEIAELSSYDEEVARAYIELGITSSKDAQDIADEIDEAYAGSFTSDHEFAQDMAKNVGETVSTQWPHYCIDWEYAARELMYDYTEQNGFYFRNV